MKKLFLIPILLMACAKNEAPADNGTPEDSIGVDATYVQPVDTVPAADSKALSQDTFDNGKTETEKIVDASQLPLAIKGELSGEPGQKFTLKIKNFNGNNLNAKLRTDEKMQNIRINQIRMPDGSFDGPFGQDLSYETPQKGEYWLIIGHNLMADGKMKGGFTLEVK
ncbi:MAG: hypothetical protein EAS48_10380 [Chryseobacterium sp.]|nr:MAG: hypothetical protein EAS48_10380 [Chryseobacterium sp.]